MTQLDCSVTSCIYNRDQLCSKEDITIGGSNATKMSDTCCESFREKGTAAMNQTGHASTTVDVDCEATKCVHNQDCKCAASHIGITGGDTVCRCSETECHDFICKC